MYILNNRTDLLKGQKLFKPSWLYVKMYFPLNVIQPTSTIKGVR